MRLGGDAIPPEPLPGLSFSGWLPIIFLAIIPVALAAIWSCAEPCCPHIRIRTLEFLRDLLRCEPLCEKLKNLILVGHVSAPRLRFSRLRLRLSHVIFLSLNLGSFAQRYGVLPTKKLLIELRAHDRRFGLLNASGLTRKLKRHSPKFVHVIFLF